MKSMTEGECYRNVYKYLTQNEHLIPGARIVHGSVLSISIGRRKRILHAWIEHDGDVIDPTQGVTISRKDYYRLVGAKAHAKYTFEQLMVMSLRNMNWGPWE
jgi:hypothetical protein